jgi:hypothetical protein
LKLFFGKLWEDYHHNNKIKSDCGTVKSHFDDFVNIAHQKATVCPFCGLSILAPSGGKHRDAYDHYLPKAVYPFISMNFKNLVPTCHTCNSIYKGTDEVLFNKSGKRRPVFYPFDKSLNSKEISFIINPRKSRERSTLLSKIEWDYIIKVDGVKDAKAQSWQDIYKIRDRYKELIPNFESTWFDDIKRKYKKALGKQESFASFKTEILDELKLEALGVPLGLLKYTYFYYQLSKYDIEKSLNYFIESNK